MILLSIPAVLSLVIKGIVLWWAREALTLKKSAILVGLLSIAMILNVTEVIGLYLLSIEADPSLLFRSYYVLLLFLACYISLYCLQTSQLEWPLNVTYVCIAAIVGCLLFIPGPLINGYESIGYSITAVKGQYYFVFRLALLLFLLSSFWFLIKGYLQARQHKTKVQCMYAGVALTPLLGVGLLVLGLQAVGIQVNAMIAVPIATTIFVIIIARTERKHQLTDIRRWLPYSQERELANLILNQASEYSVGDKSLADAVSKCEEMFIRYKMEQHRTDENGQTYNVSAAADDMQLPRSTLYNKLAKLGIDVKEKSK